MLRFNGAVDRMVVGFTTTYAISAYHHWCFEFESRSGRGAQHYVINLSVTCGRSEVFSRYSGFLHQWNKPPQYNWTINQTNKTYSRWSRPLDIGLSDWWCMYSVFTVSSNPVEREQNICQLKYIILELLYIYHNSVLVRCQMTIQTILFWDQFLCMFIIKNTLLLHSMFFSTLWNTLSL